MIQDQAALQSAQQSWETAREVRQMARAGGVSAGILSTLPASPRYAQLGHNLALFFAYSVLEMVLQQLRDEGRFACRSDKLFPLMEASNAGTPPPLNWIDHPTVDAGRDKRNKAAHHRILCPSDDCWTYLDAIDAELVGWGIVQPAAAPSP